MWKQVMTKQSPIDLDRKSFASFDAAEEMCKFLKKETGRDYKVEPDNYLGFTPCHQMAKQLDQHNSKAKNNLNGRIYRQSMKGFIPHYIEIAIGVLMIVNPYIVLSWTFKLLNINTVPEWINLQKSGNALQIIGCLAFLYGIRFVYSYLAKTLCFEKDGVILKKGIIAQNQVQVRFGDIKTVSVHQSILNRLLRIGTVHLDSAGTNGEVDIVFNNVVNPVLMRQNIQTMIDDHNRH